MMRRSSGMGGARMLRAMGRSVSAGVKEKFSTAASSGAKRAARVVSVTSPPRSRGTTTSPPPPMNRGALTCFCDGDEWETVGFGGEEESGHGDGLGFYERVVFGPAPTKQEAEEAVSTIQRLFVPVTFSTEVESPSMDEDVVDKIVTSTDVSHKDYASETESDWLEPALQLHGSKSPQSFGSQENILDAVRLFEINPPFKRMVTSLSSDPDVWDAVMKNEVVQELKKSFYEAGRSEPDTADENDISTGILRWIMESTKGKIMEFFDNISKLVSEIFHFQEKGKNKESEPFDDFVRSSFRLSVVVFIIIVMTRIQKA